MSHARAGAVYKLVFSDAGGAELLRDGATVWASDADPDFVQDFGDDLLDADAVLDDDEIADVLDWLVDAGYMTDEQGDKALVSVPESWAAADDDDQAANDDGDDDDDDDEPEEVVAHDSAH